MPLPSNPSGRRPTGRVPGRPAAGRPPVPPPAPPVAEGAPPGRRGRGPEEPPPDKRLIWGGVGAGVLLVAIILIVHFAGRETPPEEPKKNTEKGGTAVEKFPSPDTPEGVAELKKMFDRAEPAKIKKYIAGINAETAAKIKEILVPYMLRCDAGTSFNDAFAIATLLGGQKDERVLNKVLELGMKKDAAHSLLAAYGAMGASAVIEKAKADGGQNTEVFEKMLAECKTEEAVGPIREAAEGCEVASVAWICGDALYWRKMPIKLERVNSWLADANGRAQMSGVRQMSVQKEGDRDAALIPFSKAEAALEARKAVLEVASRDRTLSRDLIRNLMQIEDPEFFEDVTLALKHFKLFEYIPDLEAITGSSMGTARSRTAGRVAQELKFARGDK